jgi:hypothetical protein
MHIVKQNLIKTRNFCKHLAGHILGNKIFIPTEQIFELKAMQICFDQSTKPQKNLQGTQATYASWTHAASGSLTDPN